jgi:hypothetical protein
VTRLSNLRHWKPGQSGNPGGKPYGARNRLQGDFLNALAEHFAEHGKEAIERLCRENPAAYIKAIASLMPRQDDGGADGGLSGLSIEELRDYIEVVRTALPLLRAREAANSATSLPPETSHDG